MPNLDFQIIGVEAATRGVTPLLQFKLKISALPQAQSIEALLLNAQIQLQCPQRNYSPAEKEKLVELFGTPERWGQTLRNRLWAHSNTTVGAFSGTTETCLTVPCTFDLNIASTKYFYALEQGEVGLLFLFSGSVFYLNADGHLQVERVPWTREAVYRLPVQQWQELMEQHFPNSAWLALRRDVFDQLYQYKRRQGLANWEQTIESLLSHASQSNVELPLVAPDPVF
jgi:Family of unknown function (DUF6084)